jgi:hypothetical protein
VQEQHSLLFSTFDRYKSHRWPLYCFADRLSIGRVVLLALDVGLDELRWHEPYLMSERRDLATPIVRRVTGLNANERRLNASK